MTSRPFELVTRRLVLRPLQVDDVPAFAADRSDPDVARYQSWDTTYAPADAERLVASQDGVALGDSGVWLQLAAVDRVSGALCGDCAVRIASDQPQTAEVGVTFAPATQGSGLATESLMLLHLISDDAQSRQASRRSRSGQSRW